MRRSFAFRQRMTCQRSGEVVDVLCVFFGRAPLDMSAVDDEVQLALKAREPVPEVLYLVSFGGQAARLSELWAEDGGRAKGVLGRGRAVLRQEFHDFSIFGFKDGNFNRLDVDPTYGKYSFKFDELLRAGLAQLVAERGAFQEAPSGHLFRHPSKRQTSHLLLASELLKSEVDAYYVALTVCALAWGRMSKVDYLHIDTMGIYPVARAMEEVASTSGGISGHAWQIESFHSHRGMGNFHASVNANEAVIVSASTTGSMARQFVDDGIREDAVITLLDMSLDGRVGTVCYGHDSQAGRGGTRNRVPQSGSETAIELSGEYFVASGKKPRALTLTVEHKPAALKDILDSFGTEGCSLNRARSGQSSVSDVVAIEESLIVTNQEFQTWLKDEIRLKTPGSVTHVMSLRGEASEKLAISCAVQIELCSGRRPVTFSSDDLTSLNPADVSGVLVCAAIAGDGHLLRNASRDLREVVPLASRHFLVGVGLPSSEASWTRLEQFLIQSGVKARPYIFSVWKMLPTGAEPGLGEAWVRAGNLMQRMDRFVPDPTCPVDATLAHESVALATSALENARSGFLPCGRGKALRLTPGFVYWKVPPNLDQAGQAAAGYLSMSASLQRAREFAEAGKRLRSSLHETVVLDAENFLRFNDGVLQASLLRASFAHEIDYSGAPDQSELVREFLEKVFLNHERPYGEAALEFAFALASGHMTLTASDLRTLLERIVATCKTPSALLGFLCFSWQLCAQ